MSLRGVAVSILALALLPGHGLPGPTWACPFLRLTGRSCPACGLTRSWRAAGRLRGRDSIRYHPLGIVTLAGAAWVALDPGAETRVARSDPRLRIGAVAVWLTVWLVRVSRPVR